MNRKQVIAVCKKTNTGKINILIKLISDSVRSEGMFPYPEAEGSSRAPFGHTGFSEEEIRLAEIVEKNTPIWEDLCDEAMDKFGDAYNNGNYIEYIARL